LDRAIEDVQTGKISEKALTAVVDGVLRSTSSEGGKLVGVHRASLAAQADKKRLSVSPYLSAGLTLLK
jgi:hypothetical protein